MELAEQEIWQNKCATTWRMNTEPIKLVRSLIEREVTDRFLEAPCERSFAELFRILTPQLVAFFRARGCELTLAEDLAQEVMLTVHRKASQIRDRSLFRAWMFKVARHALSRHYGKQNRRVETVDLSDVAEHLAAARPPASTPTFEFGQWMDFLDSKEREALAMRFIEEWEYHEIAAAKAIPIGTVQWRVFNAKKKLKPHLKALENVNRRAA
jgi:RNA polymerase sigma-70 factor (ECF subfamily)